MRPTILAALLPLLAGCATASPDGKFTRTVARDYKALGACTFTLFDRRYPGWVRYADLTATNTIRIAAAEPSSIQFWTMTITKAGAGALVEIEGFPTLYSATHFSEKAWAEMQPCVTGAQAVG